MEDPDGTRWLVAAPFDGLIMTGFTSTGRPSGGWGGPEGERLHVGANNLGPMEAAYWCLSAIAAEDILGGP